MRSWLLILSVISLQALTSAQSATHAVAKANAPVYVKSNPATGAVPLRVAAAGTRFKVLSEAEAGWVQVQFADPQFGTRIGWVKADVVTLIRPDLQPMDLSVPSPG